MKKIFPVVLLAAMVGFCVWQFALPALAQTTNADDSYQRLADAQLARVKRSEAMLDLQEAMQKRGLAVLERQEKDLDRYEKILATWEKQQQQYQKYLDSLNKK